MEHFIEKSKGFSLIEILVVVSIIAILIAINLIAIGRYQNKANDTTIGANLSQIRKVAAMVYTDENSYVNICDATATLNDSYTKYPELKTIEDEVTEVTDVNPECHSSKKEYCVQTVLISNNYFCIDSNGFAGEIGGDYCSETNIKCSTP